MNVSSGKNPLAYLKAIATLVGSVVTGLLGVYAADTPVGQVLTIISVIATAIVTYMVPNADVVEGEVIESEDEPYYDGFDEDEPHPEPVYDDPDQPELDYEPQHRREDQSADAYEPGVTDPAESDPALRRL